MATAMALLNSTCFLHPKRFETISAPSFSHRIVSVSVRKSCAPMASLATTQQVVGLSETFNRLRQQKKVALITYITAGVPDLSTTAEALKVLDSCGSDIIELGVPYSDSLADGPVIQAAATRALSQGTNYDAIISMLRNVVPQLSCPIALFTYYNPILKHGTEKFMATIKDVGVHGLVVPDVSSEETEALRKEDVEYGIELVTGKPVAVGFGISKPEHVKLVSVAECGADGVIVGSALVKVLGEAKSPEGGLKQLKEFTKSLKSALP
ncbi:hypothetical protein Cgig2_021524 [Carnegiea gigantea]|uniref:tryptophan synthase n=1 Tax=Carnegiea gigantea TaxID=171969 RepID=A0A9Q1KFA1_9CARY|nr:hypothetical protein Cgig2_021524 [Carnegiea gigantea]